LFTCYDILEDLIYKEDWSPFPYYSYYEMPWQRSEITNNYFYDNDANIVMFDT